MTNTNVNNNANTNVINTANTNVNNNENNYMNGELAIGFDALVMVGEELLRVVRSNATTYHIYDTTIQSVTPFIQQVIGDCKCNMHEKVGYEVNVVTVEVYVSISGIFDDWLYEGVTGWDQTFQIRDKLEVMGIFLPAVEVERQYALWMKGFEAADTTDYFFVDNAEELAMQAEAAYLAYYEGSVDTDVDYLAYYESGVDIEIDLELGF